MVEGPLPMSFATTLVQATIFWPLLPPYSLQCISSTQHCAPCEIHSDHSVQLSQPCNGPISARAYGLAGVPFSLQSGQSPLSGLLLLFTLPSTGPSLPVPDRKVRNFPPLNPWHQLLCALPSPSQGGLL